MESFYFFCILFSDTTRGVYIFNRIVSRRTDFAIKSCWKYPSWLPVDNYEQYPEFTTYQQRSLFLDGGKVDSPWAVNDNSSTEILYMQ
jgi:hypothetical protein